MKLNPTGKIKHLPRLWEITERSYTGVELPPRELFERYIRDGDVFVTPEGGRIEGYALVMPAENGCYPLILSIAVLKGWRGHGFATMMLTEIAGYYKGRGDMGIILHCKVDNPAQTLYFKEGYRVTAVLRGYYKPEGDGLEMRKML